MKHIIMILIRILGAVISKLHNNSKRVAPRYYGIKTKHFKIRRRAYVRTGTGRNGRRRLNMEV